MLMSRKKADQKHSIKISNRSYEGVAKFKYLGTTITDQNCMQETIKFGESLLSFGPEPFFFPPAV
jgi:hypothetical protein